MSNQKPLLVLTLPLLGALACSLLVHILNSGLLSVWRPLGRPPGDVATLTARYEAVWATLADGRVYSQTTRTACGTACWQPAEAIPADQLYGPAYNDCPLPRVDPSLRLFTVRCEGYGTMGTQLDVYALRADGQVWWWQRRFGGESAMMLAYCAPVTGAGLGLVMLLIVSVEALGRARDQADLEPDSHPAEARSATEG